MNKIPAGLVRSDTVFVAVCHLSHDWLEPAGNVLKIFQAIRRSRITSNNARYADAIMDADAPT